MISVAKIQKFIDSNIKTLRPLVKELKHNQECLNQVREELSRIGSEILGASEWLSDMDNVRVLEDKHAWTLTDYAFADYSKIRYEKLKESEVIRNVIPNIDEIGHDTCVSWIFNQHIIRLSNELLSKFDDAIGTKTSKEYSISRRNDIIETICSAIEHQCFK